MGYIFDLELITFMMRSLIKQIRNCSLSTICLNLYEDAYK